MYSIRKSKAPWAEPRWLEAYAQLKVRGSPVIQPPGVPTTWSSGTNTSWNFTPHEMVERMPSICQSSRSSTPSQSTSTTANTRRLAYEVSPSTAHHTIRYLAVAATEAKPLRAVSR